MLDVVIKVDNLSKKYILDHQKKQSAGDGLRHILNDQINAVFSSLFSRNSKNKELFPSKEEFWALKNISFEVKRGEKVGIIGKNGAGKSTLLKILSRIMDPTEGRVTIVGRVASLLEVGTGFHPELTGRENIYLNGSILGMRKAEIDRKFDEIVAFSEVEKFLDTPVKKYSSGMTVRLAFSVAAHLESEILIVDEVLSVGDATFQKKCLGKMEDVGQQGRTIFFVSHNIPTVSRLCERVILLKSGQLQAQGATDEMLALYLLSGGSQGSWVAPEEEKSLPLGLLQVKLMGSRSDEARSVIHFDEEVRIEVSYQINEELIEPWFIRIRITNASGEVVFSSWDTDTLHQREMSIGQYRETCTVPSKLMKPGSYTLSVGAFKLSGVQKRVEKYADHPEIITFDISDIGYPLNSGRDGTITPLLNWTQEAIGATHENFDP
jgi:lipopolysaccharide transport system ATP-binding protein